MSDDFDVFNLDCFNYNLFNIFYFVSNDFNLFRMLHFDYFDINSCKLQVFYAILGITVM